MKNKSAKAAIAVVIIILLSNSGCIGISSNEWAFEITEIDDLQNKGLDGNGIVIGIVDTGIQADHPELEEVSILRWKDFVNEKTKPYDDNGHGTHVAGIIAARGSWKGIFHGVKLKGIVPNVKLIIAKAIPKDMKGNDGDVVEGIEFCVEEGAHIICLSLGGNSSFTGKVGRACENAISEGVFIVAAAGNDGNDSKDVSSPASVDGVIAVGAVDRNGKIASFSSKGDNGEETPDPRDDREYPDEKPELAAPGVDIISTWNENKYAKASGTSQAVPFVVGIIALLLEAFPEYKRDGEKGGEGAVELFKEIFALTAKSSNGHDDRYGYGLIRALDAYNALKYIH